MGNQVPVSSREAQGYDEYGGRACGSFSFWKGSSQGKSKFLLVDVDLNLNLNSEEDETTSATAAAHSQLTVSTTSHSRSSSSSDDCSLWDPYNTRRGRIPSAGSWITFSSSFAAPSSPKTEQQQQHQQQQHQFQSTSENSSIAPAPASITDYTAEELLLSDTEATTASDLTLPRQVWIVTTAALPWMTGTAVNPLLRAAYLALQQRDSSSTNTADVHLVLPWLENATDRGALYSGDATFHWSDEHLTWDDQATYIQQWLLDNVYDYTTDLVQIHWYPARYHAKLGSIFAMGDVCDRLEPVAADAVCILEEPEHLNYYRGGRWRTKFAHVAGVIHTNYCQYAEQHYSGTNSNKKFSNNRDNSNSVGKLVAAPLVGAISAWMVRAYCDKVIQLSATLPSYAPEKEVVCNVHGVRPEFLAQTYYDPGNDSNILQTQEPQIYFLGKLLWAKGLDKLLQLEQHCMQSTGSFFAVDVYGSGPDQEDIQHAFRLGYAGRLRRGSECQSSNSNCSTLDSLRIKSYSERAVAYIRGDCKEKNHEFSSANPLPVNFPGRIDHAKIDKERLQRGLGCYKTFVNPSVSEVLCTVTAEALAMGKFVIVPNHPSNTFFEQFPNCLQYNTDDEFLQRLEFAFHNEPKPLSEASREVLTWQGATVRLYQAVSISHREAARRDRLRSRDERLADWHIQLGTGTTGDVLRHVLGGGPVANQSRYSSSNSSSSLTNLTRHHSKLGRSEASLVGSSNGNNDVADTAISATLVNHTTLAIPMQC